MLDGVPIALRGVPANISPDRHSLRARPAGCRGCCSDVKVYNSTGNNVSDNYAITLENEYFHILKRKLLIVPKAQQATYKEGFSYTGYLKISDVTRSEEGIDVTAAFLSDPPLGHDRLTTDALYSMNNSTSEVRSAATEMSEGNKMILSEVTSLQEYTRTMKNSMDEMAVGARKINETGATLSEITSNVKSSIDKIGKQIDQFKV